MTEEVVLRSTRATTHLDHLGFAERRLQHARLHVVDHLRSDVMCVPRAC
jgi:hypothetical protein